MNFFIKYVQLSLNAAQKSLSYIYIHKKYCLLLVIQLLYFFCPYKSVADPHERRLLRTSHVITPQVQQNLFNEFFQAQQEYMEIKNLLTTALEQFQALQNIYLTSVAIQKDLISQFLCSVGRGGAYILNYGEIQLIKLNQQTLLEQINQASQSVSNRMSMLQSHVTVLEEIQSIIGPQGGIVSELIALHTEYFQHTESSSRFIYEIVNHECTILEHHLNFVEKIEQARRQGRPLPPFPDKEARMVSLVLERLLLKPPPTKKGVFASLLPHLLKRRLSESSDEEATTSFQAMKQQRTEQSSEYDASNEDSDEESYPISSTSSHIALHRQDGQSSTGGTSSFIAHYNNQLQIHSLQGLQYVFHNVLTQFTMELKQLALMVTNWLSNSKMNSPKRTTPIVPYMNHKGEEIIINLPTPSLCYNSPESMFKTVNNCPLHRVNKPEPKKIGYFSTSLSGLAIGLGSIHNSYTPSMYTSMISSTSAKVQTKGLFATLTWNMDEYGPIGCVIGTHHWGQMKTAQTMLFDIPKRDVIPITISGIFVQLGYNLPLLCGFSATPYIESKYVVGKYKSCYRGLDLFSHMLKNQERLVDHVVGIRIYSKIKGVSLFQLWFEKNSRQQSLDILGCSSLLQSRSLYNSRLKGYRKSYMYSEIGLSFDYMVNDALSIHAVNSFTLKKIKDMYKVQLQCNIMYAF